MDLINIKLENICRILKFTTLNENFQKILINKILKKKENN